MPLDQIPQFGAVLVIIDAGDPDHLLVDVTATVALLIEHIGHSTGHAGGEVAAGCTQHHDPSARHVLAAVIAHTLDDGFDAAVTHGETLPRHAAEVRLARGRPVQCHVADDDVLFGYEGRG